MFPESFSDEEKARLTADYEKATQEIYDATTRMRDFLRDEYLPVARESIGLSDMKGGAKLYQLMVEGSTTLPMTPDELHNLGLKEVPKKLSRKKTIPSLSERKLIRNQAKITGKEDLTITYPKIRSMRASKKFLSTGNTTNSRPK